MVTVAKKNLIFLVIFSLVFGQLIRINIAPEIYITPLNVLVTILVFIWLLSGAKFQGKLAKPIIIFLFFSFFSLIYNSQVLAPNEILISFLYFVRLAVLMCFYFVIQELDKVKIKGLMLALASIGFLLALLGILQYFFYPDLRNLTYAGWDEHLYRLFGTFLDPNFSGAFFVLMLILFIGLLRLRYSGYIIFPAILIILSALVLTYSRSAYLMFVVSMIVVFILESKVRKLIILISALFIIGLFLIPKNLPSEGVRLERTASGVARFEEARHAVTIFKDNPIFGVGFNAYRFAQKRYGFANVEESHAGAGTDNSFLFVLATTGIVGFLAFINLWYKILKIAFSKKKTTVSLIVLAGGTGLLINSFFINSLFYESIMAAFFIMLGAMEKT